MSAAVGDNRPMKLTRQARSGCPLRIRLGFFVVALALLGRPDSPRADGPPDRWVPEETAARGEPRFFLTWNAPFGVAGSRERIAPSCDSTALDTLYVCFDPGRDSAQVVGGSVTIRFWPAMGDTLAPHWRFEQRTGYGGLRAQLNPDSTGLPRLWETGGMGGLRYRSQREGGTTRIVYAVPSVLAATVRAGQRYVFARLLVPRPALGASCAAPLCVELEQGSVAFGRKDEVFTKRGSRFVVRGTGDGEACATYREIGAVRRWTPPKR